tara:strand:+ start:330 stop:830 length:501 start_codon:yes stop_codon:yes gene_type:complete
MNCKTDIDFYREYHTHPANIVIHCITIPILVITVLDFFSTFKLHFKTDSVLNTYWGKKYTIKLDKNISFNTLLIYFYILYYFTWGFYIGLIMTAYCLMMNFISNLHRIYRVNWIKESLVLFVIGWILQFLGHYIEGNRPALLTSLSQAFLTAPAFSFIEILPFNLL